jgi:hypothetical protein
MQAASAAGWSGRGKILGHTPVLQHAHQIAAGNFSRNDSLEDKAESDTVSRRIDNETIVIQNQRTLNRYFDLFIVLFELPVV